METFFKKYIKNRRSLLIIAVILLVVVSFIIRYKTVGQNQANSNEAVREPIIVKVQTVAQSRSVVEEITYPAIVQSEKEAKIIAKTSGTVKEANFNLGDRAAMGSVLIKIDDVNQGTSGFSGGFTSSQIQQAQLAAELARTNKSNLGLTGGENLKNAQIALATAKIAVEQARLNLEDRKKILNQSGSDSNTNATAAIETAASWCQIIISGINNIAGFDNASSADLTYTDLLGKADTQISVDTKFAYEETRDFYNQYAAIDFGDIDTRLDETIKLAEKIKNLIDIFRSYLDASILTTQLNSTVLGGFKATVVGYQTQISVTIAQLNGAKQALENINLNSDATLNALQKAYESSQEQERNAEQNLNSLQAANKSQLDAADFQYRNALVALQSLYDTHLGVAPISGTITRKLVSTGDTVSTGQVLATISQAEAIKVQFYIDQEVLANINLDTLVKIKNNDGILFPALITSISPQADDFTKRFLIEARPSATDFKNLILGTVVDILVTIEKKAQGEQNIILPLAAVEIGQNSNAIFTVKDGVAHRIDVVIDKIQGETAEIKTSLPADDLIVVDGNKLINDGDPVKTTD